MKNTDQSFHLVLFIVQGNSTFQSVIKNLKCEASYESY